MYKIPNSFLSGNAVISKHISVTPKLLYQHSETSELTIPSALPGTFCADSVLLDAQRCARLLEVNGAHSKGVCLGSSTGASSGAANQELPQEQPGQRQHREENGSPVGKKAGKEEERKKEEEPPRAGRSPVLRGRSAARARGWAAPAPLPATCRSGRRYQRCANPASLPGDRSARKLQRPPSSLRSREGVSRGCSIPAGPAASPGRNSSSTGSIGSVHGPAAPPPGAANAILAVGRAR